MRGKSRPRGIIRMVRKRVGLVALLAMILTFTLLTAALATPGWMIVSTTKSLDKSEISGMRTFYRAWCTNGYLSSMYIDLHVEAVSALILCMVGLYFVLLNRGSRCKIVGGRNVILFATNMVAAADVAIKQGLLVEILLPYTLAIAGFA